MMAIILAAMVLWQPLITFLLVRHAEKQEELLNEFLHLHESAQCCSVTDSIMMRFPNHPAIEDIAMGEHCPMSNFNAFSPSFFSSFMPRFRLGNNMCSFCRELCSALRTFSTRLRTDQLAMVCYIREDQSVNLRAGAAVLEATSVSVAFLNTTLILDIPQFDPKKWRRALHSIA